MYECETPYIDTKVCSMSMKKLNSMRLSVFIVHVLHRTKSLTYCCIADQEIPCYLCVPKV